jgi:hypothetical protein
MAVLCVVLQAEVLYHTAHTPGCWHTLPTDHTSCHTGCRQQYVMVHAALLACFNPPSLPLFGWARTAYITNRLPKTEPSTVSINGLKSAVAGIFMTTKFSVKKHFLRFAIDAAYRKPDTYHFLTLPACAFFA